MTQIQRREHLGDAVPEERREDGTDHRHPQRSAELAGGLVHRGTGTDLSATERSHEGRRRW